ncbi:hypothetical protein V1512DRAFT_255974 [Lipomyces arxii]|uniref:uncharacterized protein n=1 Tax=Lipomyces arxii TaxID=56418 RepID=UPI0034CE7D7A
MSTDYSLVDWTADNFCETRRLLKYLLEHEDKQVICDPSNGDKSVHAERFRIARSIAVDLWRNHATIGQYVAEPKSEAHKAAVVHYGKEIQNRVNVLAKEYQDGQLSTSKTDTDEVGEKPRVETPYYDVLCEIMNCRPEISKGTAHSCGDGSNVNIGRDLKRKGSPTPNWLRRLGARRTRKSGSIAADGTAESSEAEEDWSATDVAAFLESIANTVNSNQECIMKTISASHEQQKNSMKMQWDGWDEPSFMLRLLPRLIPDYIPPEQESEILQAMREYSQAKYECELQQRQQDRECQEQMFALELQAVKRMGDIQNELLRDLISAVLKKPLT